MEHVAKSRAFHLYVVSCLCHCHCLSPSLKSIQGILRLVSKQNARSLARRCPCSDAVCCIAIARSPPHYPAFSNASSHQRLRRQRPLSLFMPSSHLKPRRQHRCLSSYQHRIRDHSLPFLYTPVSRSSVPVGWLCSSQYAMWSCRRSLASVMSRRASHISISHA
jgi:hypothetical protein